METSELIKIIALEAGISKEQAEAALKAFVRVANSTLVNGEKITIKGFGSFYTKSIPIKLLGKLEIASTKDLGSNTDVCFKASNSFFKPDGGTNDSGPEKH